MPDHVFSQPDIHDQLAALGVRPGMVLLVHSAFSRIKPIDGGPRGLIAALEAYLGPNGTLVMPSMSYDDEHIFDPATTPCVEEVGIVPDTFWRLPHVWRGANMHAFAASGIHAAHITAPSPLTVPHGLDSPVGRVYELGGYVLLLGVGHSANTTIHLAENLAGVRYHLPARAMILEDGTPIWIDFTEVNHCCKNFQKMDAWLDERGLQRKGKIGNANARLIASKGIVETALEHLRQEETVFLHPPGVDEECDEARASMNM